MQFSSTSYNKIFADTAQKLADRAGINNYGPGSKASALIDTFIEDKKREVASIQEVLSSNKISEASDEYLEELGAKVGAFKQKATKAYTRASDRNFMFYVDTGTFGDINNGSSFTIPAGEIVYLQAKNNTSGQKVEFVTKTTTTCLASASVAYVSVEAHEYGSKNNVAKGTLTNHNFTSYTLSSQNKLKCKNNYSIVNGRDEMSNASYRNLISKAYVAWAMANENSLRYSAKSIAGVKDIKIIKGYAGIGTIGVIVDSFEGKISSLITDNVFNQLKNIVSSGETVFVYPPKYIGVQLNLVVKTSVALSDATKINMSNYIKTLIKDYINSLSISEPLDLQSLYNHIIINTNNVTKIGKKSNVNSAESVYLYFYDNFDNYSIKEFVTSTIAADEDQKIILMEDVENPISLTIET